MSRFALEGVHVLDFAWVGVGPITTKYFADNGAEVIRIESAARPDVLRIGPPWKDAMPGINRSQFFASFNTSKKGITLDLGKPKARELAKRMVPWADIVVESFTPKAMRNWGLDYENLREINPDLIMLSTCMQGQTGTQRDLPRLRATDGGAVGLLLHLGLRAGLMHAAVRRLHGFHRAALFAFALLAALDYRRRTGQGQYIDMSQYEAAMQNLAPALIDYFATGRVLGPRGNASERYAPHGAYRCADEDGNERWIAIAVAGDEQWRAMLTALGADTTDRRFATAQGRIENAGAIDELVGSLTRIHDAHELTAKLQAAGVAAYPVENCVDIHQDDNLEAFGFWHWLEHKEMGPSPYEGLEHRMSRTPGALRSAAPILGQDNDEVFREMLSLSADEIEQLKNENVIF